MTSDGRSWPRAHICGRGLRVSSNIEWMSSLWFMTLMDWSIDCWIDWLISRSCDWQPGACSIRLHMCVCSQSLQGCWRILALPFLGGLLSEFPYRASERARERAREREEGKGNGRWRWGTSQESLAQHDQPTPGYPAFIVFRCLFDWVGISSLCNNFL